MTAVSEPSSVPQAAIPADPALADPQDTPKPAAKPSVRRRLLAELTRESIDAGTYRAPYPYTEGLDG